MTPLALFALLGGLTAAPPPKPVKLSDPVEEYKRAVGRLVDAAKEHREVLVSGTEKERLAVVEKIDAIYKQVPKVPESLRRYDSLAVAGNEDGTRWLIWVHWIPDCYRLEGNGSVRDRKEFVEMIDRSIMALERNLFDKKK